MWKVQRLISVTWEDVSEHTLEADAERQVTIYIAGGVPEEELRIVAPE